MARPKNFSEEAAAGEEFELDPNNQGQVFAYRFGDRQKPDNWISQRRRARGGSFPRPSDNVLNDWVLKQTSYGSSAEAGAGNPFISVATDTVSLFDNGEGWVQKILRDVPDLGKFSVPFHLLFRSSPVKPLSTRETEWVFYDGDHALEHYRVAWLANPYKL